MKRNFRATVYLTPSTSSHVFRRGGRVLNCIMGYVVLEKTINWFYTSGGRVCKTYNTHNAPRNRLLVTVDVGGFEQIGIIHALD